MEHDKAGSPSLDIHRHYLDLAPMCYLSAQIVVCFPVNTCQHMLQKAGMHFDAAEYAKNGELMYLESKLAQKSGNKFVIVALPQILWELMYLLEYCKQRVESTYADDESIHDEVPLFVDCFFWDHRTSTNLSLETFADAIFKALTSESYSNAAHEANYKVGSLLLARLPDLTTETSVCLSHALCQDLLDDTLFSFGEFRCASESNLSVSLQVWPLTRPGLLEAAENAGIAEEMIVDLFLHEFMDLVTEILTFAGSGEFEHLRNSLGEFRSRAARDAPFRLLADKLCPITLDDSFHILTCADVKKLKNALRFTDKADSALFSLTSDAMDKLLFHQVLNLELSDDLREGFTLLYRATTSSKLDSTIWTDGRPHSLSFGSSLIAGIRFDRSATCYNYAQKARYGDLYAVRIPVRACMEDCTIFFIPPIPPLLQLASLGEMFHPRTKLHCASSLDPRSFASGILQCTVARLPDFLRIDRNPEDEFRLNLRNDSIFIRKGPT